MTTPADPKTAPIARIMRLFKPYRARLTTVSVLIVASAAISLIRPFLLRAVLDVAFPERRVLLLTVLCGSLVAVALTLSAVAVVQGNLSLTVGQHVMHDLRTAVYSHLNRLSLSFFTKTRTGEVQSRIANDIGAMDATVTNTATTIMGSVTTVLASVIAMLALSWEMTVVSLLTVPVFVWISGRVGEERRVLTYQRQQELAAISSIVEESLSVSGFLLGRVMGRTTALNTEFTRQSEGLTKITIRSVMAGRWRQATVQMIIAVMPIAIYWTAGLIDARGQAGISIGTVIAFTTLQQGLLSPAVTLLQTSIALKSSLSLFERVFEYLDLEVEVPEPRVPILLPTPRGHVRFRNVDFAYGDELPVLRNLDIDMPPGKHLAVVGPTGAGKTTLGYLTARLYDATAGSITIDGVDLRALSFDTLAATVGVVSQDTHLFHASIAENLRFAKSDATAEELVAVARAAQIHDLIMNLPDGYDTTVGERGYRFSGGEKQRIGIARTMLRSPTVLVLDEATSALDNTTERAVQRAVDALCAGRTTITIAHRLSTVRDADEILVLGQGRIVERGIHEDLLALGGTYARLVATAVQLTTSHDHATNTSTVAAL